MPPPSPLPQRVASIQTAIAAEREPLVALTHLLQLCRDEHPILQERIQDAGCRAKAEQVTAGVRALLPTTSTGPELGPQVAAALAAALTADAPADYPLESLWPLSWPGRGKSRCG